MRPFLVYGLLLGLAGCRPVEKATPIAEAEWFVDQTEQSGLIFTHFNGMTGDFYYPEVMPPGIALFDFDADGDLDVFVVQGEMFSGKLIESALVAPKSPLTSRLVSQRRRARPFGRAGRSERTGPTASRM